jgi:hypothetical protein
MTAKPRNPPRDPDATIAPIMKIAQAAAISLRGTVRAPSAK